MATYLEKFREKRERIEHELSAIDSILEDLGRIEIYYKERRTDEDGNYLTDVDGNQLWFENPDDTWMMARLNLIKECKEMLEKKADKVMKQ